MWDCPSCGCMAIAADLEFCPVCREPRSDLAGGAEPPGTVSEASAAGKVPGEKTPTATDKPTATVKGGPKAEGWGDSA